MCIRHSPLGWSYLNNHTTFKWIGKQAMSLCLYKFLSLPPGLDSRLWQGFLWQLFCFVVVVVMLLVCHLILQFRSQCSFIKYNLHTAKSVTEYEGIKLQTQHLLSMTHLVLPTLHYIILVMVLIPKYEVVIALETLKKSY